MDKSPDAFRTISEVAELLDTPAHVLRFWESRFAQIRPVKRAGGRRYYRPGDVALLAGIRALLHDQGVTIRGVQKMLRERGVRQIAMVGQAALEGRSVPIMAAALEDRSAPEPPPAAPPLAVRLTDPPPRHPEPDRGAIMHDLFGALDAKAPPAPSADPAPAQAAEPAAPVTAATAPLPAQGAGCDIAAASPQAAEGPFSPRDAGGTGAAAAAAPPAEPPLGSDAGNAEDARVGSPLSAAGRRQARAAGPDPAAAPVPVEPPPEAAAPPDTATPPEPPGGEPEPPPMAVRLRALPPGALPIQPLAAAVARLRVLRARVAAAARMGV